MTLQFPKGQSFENLNDSPFLIANHQSYLDGIIIATELNYPKIMSMAAVKNAPFIGNFMNDMEVIWVDRYQMRALVGPRGVEKDNPVLG